MIKMISLLVLLLFFSGCNTATNEEDEGQQLANPASEYCEKQGGILRIDSDETGQNGICLLPNGNECEEWAYYRGECS